MQTHTANITLPKQKHSINDAAAPPSCHHFQHLPVSLKKVFASFWAKHLPNTALFPLIHKQPVSNLAWSDLRQTSGVHGSHEDWERATGYAVAPTCDEAVHIVDVDQNWFIGPLLEAVPELIKTMWVQRGKRLHFYFIPGQGLQKASISLRDKDKVEIASIRGVGAYAVGPWSDHPSGDTYEPNNPRYIPIITLTVEQTQKLYQLFEHTPNQPRLVCAPWGPSNKLKQDIASKLRSHGYKPTGKEGWLVGPCLFAHQHKGGTDCHRSGSYNVHSATYRCFACDTHTLREVTAYLNLSFKLETTKSKPAFEGQLMFDRGGLVVEMNLTSELLRRQKVAAHRLVSILWQHSRENGGKSTYEHQQILEAAAAFGLKEHHVKYAIEECIEIGALRRTKRGRYIRTGIQKLKEKLELNTEHKACAELPSDLPLSIREYTNELMLLFYPFLPQGLSSQQIAAVMGVSRSRLYKGEAALNVQRHKQIQYLGDVEPRQGFTFVICRARDGRIRWSVNDESEYTKRLNDTDPQDRLEFYKQDPSLRTPPDSPPTTQLIPVSNFD